MRQGDVVHFLHTDHLGSTSLTTDATGAPIAQIRYLPYSEQRWTDGETPTDFTFTGQRADSFGLLDYNARYYSPRLGRFISPDTVIPDPTNPQNLNRYSYVLGNPVRYTDPSGHWGGDGMGLAMPMETYEGVMGGSGGGGGLVIALAVSTIIIAQNAPEISEAMSDVFIPPYVPADQEGFTLQESSSALSPGPTLDMPAWDPVYSYPLGNNEPVTFGLDFPAQPLDLPNVFASKEYSTYTMIDKTGKVKYVGRTTNLQAREKQHKQSQDKGHLDLVPDRSGLTYPQVRGREQILIDAYGLENLLNRINGIRPDNPRREEYLRAGANID